MVNKVSDSKNLGFMSKEGFVDFSADHLKVSKTEAAKIINGFVQCVTAALHTGVNLRITGFGTFTVTHRPKTTGRDPRTRAPITIEAKHIVRFRAGSNLKDSVNK